MTIFLWPIAVAVAVLCVLWLNRDLLMPTSSLPDDKEALDQSSSTFR